MVALSSTLSLGSLGILNKSTGGVVTPPEPVYDPSVLFAAGETGAWYDPSDLSTMFQDEVGIIPATLDMPIALLKDKSGNGWDLTQSTTSKRPVLRQENGLYFLEFDGVDDFIGGERYNYNEAETVELFLAYQYTQSADSVVMSFGGNYTSGWYITLYDAYTNAEIRVRSNAGNQWTAGKQPRPPAPQKSILYSAFQDVAGSKGRIWTHVDGISELDNVEDTRSYYWGYNKEMVIGTYLASNQTKNFPGKFYGAITRGGTRSDSTAVALAEQYLAEKSGVAL